MLTRENGSTDYGDDLQKVFERFNTQTSNYSSALQIAEVIYQVATDEKDTLRYVAGADAQKIADACYQMSLEEFYQMIKQNFGLA